MKINLKKVFILLFSLLLGFVTILAAPNPPPPNGRNQGPPPPPGLPIDENKLILVFLTLVFGVYVVFKHSAQKKVNSSPK